MSPEGSTFLFERCPAGLDRRRLRAFHRRIEAEVTGGGSFNCLLTRDAKLQVWNREYLGADYPTDVLSFPAPSPTGGLGEIAISYDRAAAQAAEFGHTIEDEIEILILHGSLHLMGMDHETDRGQMARAESRWRKHLSLPNNLIQRARKRA